MTEAFRSGFSVHTSRLIDRLSKGVVNEQLTRQELAEVAGCEVDLGSKGYTYIQSAIRFVERNGLVWRWDKGGKVYRCLDADGTVNLIGGYSAVIYRRSGRAVRVASTVDRSKVTSPEKLRTFDLQTLQVAMARQSVSVATLRRLAESVKDSAKLTAPTADELAGLMK